MSQAMTRTTHWRFQKDSVPSQLWLRQAIIAGLTLLLAMFALFDYRTLHQVAQTVGKDAVPSITAAENIRTTLASAHTELINAFLNKEGANGPSMTHYQQQLASAHNQILTAAQNITYGDSERGPILELMNRVSEYEREVGAAINAHVPDDHLYAADTLMREKILPAAQQLDQANFSQLGQIYSDFVKDEGSIMFTVCATIVGLVLALIETQIYLYRQFRRVVNVPLAAATALVVVFGVLFVHHANVELSSLHSAKEDAFDSMNALSRAEAVAYEANADESLYLLLNGDSRGQDAETARFQQAAQTIWSGEVEARGSLPADLSTLKGKGLLGDELANLTFPGEGDAATKALNRWLDYVRIDQGIRRLEASGNHAVAVKLCLGAQAGESDWAFEQFDKALNDTYKINADAFDTYSAAAFSHARWLLYCVIAFLVLPLLGSLIGLQLRLAEFRE